MLLRLAHVVCRAVFRLATIRALLIAFFFLYCIYGIPERRSGKQPIPVLLSTMSCVLRFIFGAFVRLVVVWGWRVYASWCSVILAYETFFCVILCLYLSG